MEVSEEDLEAAATQSGVLDCPEDFLDIDCRNHFQEHIHDANEIAANDCVGAYNPGQNYVDTSSRKYFSHINRTPTPPKQC